MEFKTIKYQKKDKYAIITLNRPDKLNALNKQMFDDLDSAITNIELDREIHALIITGEGKAFAAGADIKELHESDERSGKHFSEYGSKVMAKLEAMTIPVIAAVNGFALGGGCELTLSCHIRYASEHAKFGQPEVNLGILPGYGGTQRLTRILGVSRSMEMNLTGDMIDAKKAKEVGLVNDVYSAEDLIPEVIKTVEKILSKGLPAVHAVVESVMASTKMSLKEGLEFESRKFGEICGTEDFKEGTLAFIEKRKPNFKGK